MQNLNNVTYLEDNTRTDNPILHLQPVSFQYKQEIVPETLEEMNDISEQTIHYGLVAQDVMRILPEIVYQNQDSTYSINYNELIPLLVLSIQEMSAEISYLKSKLTELQETNNH